MSKIDWDTVSFALSMGLLFILMCIGIGIASQMVPLEECETSTNRNLIE